MTLDRNDEKFDRWAKSYVTIHGEVMKEIYDLQNEVYRLQLKLSLGSHWNDAIKAASKVCEKHDGGAEIKKEILTLLDYA